MQKTKYSKRVDSMGRITLPIRLREELGIEIGNNYEFFITEADNVRYLCIACPDSESKIQEAKEILKRAGVEI